MELKNFMEIVVWDNVDKVMEESGVCTCERCRLDTVAIALNQLAPQYVVTERGLVFSKVKEMEQQYHTDIIAAIAAACASVKDRPRHDSVD